LTPLDAVAAKIHVKVIEFQQNAAVRQIFLITHLKTSYQKKILYLQNFFHSSQIVTRSSHCVCVYLLLMGVGNFFVTGGPLWDMSLIFLGGPKLVKFVSFHSKLRKQSFC